MLSDATKMKYLPSRKRRDVGAATSKSWSDSQKIEAVTTFVMLGSLKMVSGVLKIPLSTLKLWRKSEWWQDVERDIRTSEDLVLSARLKKIVNKSYDVLEDRLENGDFVYDQKTGEMRRKPVNMRDAHRVAMDLTEASHELVERHMEEKTITVDSIEKKLNDLAASFAKIASQQNKPQDVTDVIFGTIEKKEDGGDAT